MTEGQAAVLIAAHDLLLLLLSEFPLPPNYPLMHQEPNEGHTDDHDCCIVYIGCQRVRFPIFSNCQFDENLHFLAPTRATATTTTNCGNYNNNNNDNTYKYNMPFQFLVCEVLNLIIVVGNIYLTDFFLGGRFMK